MMEPIDGASNEPDVAYHDPSSSHRNKNKGLQDLDCVSINTNTSLWWVSYTKARKN